MSQKKLMNNLQSMATLIFYGELHVAILTIKKQAHEGSNY